MTTHLYLKSRFRISGVIPLLALHAFMACKGKHLPLYIIIIIIIIIFIYCNWVVTQWQWLFYMYTKYEIS
jgi:hypothetical protein